MKGSSKDSRSWKPMGLPQSSFVSSVPSPSPAPAASIKPEPGSNSLRPASPPKVNPWQTASKAPKPKPVPLDLFSEDPPLPGTSWKVDGGQEECKSPPPLSIASTHSASSAQPETSASRTHRSDSTSSNGSQTALQAAVPRVTENLWVHPFGADVRVVTSTMSFMVHRDIVTAQSGWFRDNLPPANEDGSMVDITLTCAPETAAYCLRFMYTQRIEICDESEPSDPAHLSRCALVYCAAVYLRVKGMVAHILRVIENTANDLARMITSRVLDHEGQSIWWFDFGPNHLYGALDIMYGQSSQELMKPFRLAMGGIFDATLFWLLARPQFVHQLASQEWMVWMPRILADQIEYRQLRERSYSWTGSVIPDDAALDTLLANDTLSRIVA
uniref:BTB domain-containing protein n=3 Tax=Bionectria ochroleuca TaxID=29856 RepID=A0A0B7JXB4_BIOOC